MNMTRHACMMTMMMSSECLEGFWFCVGVLAGGLPKCWDGGHPVFDESKGPL